ncbi:MAG: PQQ-binding-like beta-propeller repeat protein [Bryobacteraceae bacterium]
MPARAAALVAAFVILSPAQEWPQWRGPNRDGVAVGFPAPQKWPEKLKLKWKVEIGEGHSSPVVSGGRVYLHSRQGEREVVSCLRLENGQAIWRESYPAPYQVVAVAASHGNGVKSTPVVGEGRIFTLGISGILSSFDAQTGKLAWRKQFAAPLYGNAMSPLLDRGLLIAHVEMKRGGALTAFDARTGAEKWSWTGDGAAYASPIVAELGGVRQIVTQSREHIVSVDAATGALLWSMPYSTAYDQNAVTPALYRDLLIFSGLRNGIMGVRAARRGNAFAAETVWTNRDISLYMSSPVVIGDVVFGLTNRNSGQFFALDPRNGKVLWTSDGRQGDNAVLIGAGPRLVLLTTDAALIVANQSVRAWEPLRKYSVAGSPTWAHPALLNNGILVKDAMALSFWEMP